MPVGRSSLLAFLVGALLLVSCSESPLPQKESNPLAAAGPPGSCDVMAIANAISDLYTTEPGLENQGLAKCSNILKKIEDGDRETALQMALEWLNQAFELLADGQGTSAADVNALFALVFDEIGALGDPGTDTVLEVITPAGGPVTVPSGFAGANFDPNDVTDDTYVIITRLDDPRFPGDCVPGFGFDLRPGFACYPLFFDYTVIPEENINGNILIGQCVIDPGFDPLAPANNTILSRIQLAGPNESGDGIVLFPVVQGPSNVDCSPLLIASGEDDWRSDLWASLGPLQYFFSVTPAYANPGNIGASIGAFSPKIPVDPGASVVTGWDTTRGGYSSLRGSNESSTTQARNATTTFLSGQGLETTIGQTNEITASALAGASIGVFGTVRTNSSGITAPLSPAEQTALGSFVDNGGCAILLPDNSTFAGAASDAINESLIDPFGFDIMGTRSGGVTSSPTEAESAVLDGFDGVVSEIQHNFAGWFDGLNGATVLAELDDADETPNPSVIELEYGAGRVIAVSDANTFFGGGAGRFSSADNETLFVNSLAACLGVEAPIVLPE